MEKEELEDIQKGIDNFYETIRIDENNFETKITYLNAGAIALMLTFLSFQDGYIVNFVLMVLGMSFCGISLIVNIVQYMIVKSWHRESIDKLIKAKNKGTYLAPDDLIDLVCRKVDRLNACFRGHASIHCYDSDNYG